MASSEHLKHFHQGVDAWNRWRRKNRAVQPDLSHADLRGANFRAANLNHANLRFANLEGANLGRAYLEAAELEGATPRGAHMFDADLGHADLHDADLEEAQLWHVRLEGANLRSAHLAGADLRFSDLSDADLTDADLACCNLKASHLTRTDLSGSRLTGVDLQDAHIRRCLLDRADLANARMAQTSLEDIDLSGVRGLEKVRHDQASSVGLDTLERTAAGLSRESANRDEVETFLRRAGVSERYLELFRSAAGSPDRTCAAYLHHSQADHDFAVRLYDALQGRGIRCWRCEHPMLPGDEVTGVSHFRHRDRVVLCASAAALASWWVDGAIDSALEQEKLQNEKDGDGSVLLAVDLDGSLAGSGPREDELRPRSIADFTDRGDDRAFEAAVGSVVVALRG